MLEQYLKIPTYDDKVKVSKTNRRGLTLLLCKNNTRDKIQARN